jgi:hypothetical protein
LELYVRDLTVEDYEDIEKNISSNKQEIIEEIYKKVRR